MNWWTLARSPMARRGVIAVLVVAFCAGCVIALLGIAVVTSLGATTTSPAAGAAPVCGTNLIPTGAVTGGEREANATAIIAVGQAMGVPRRGWVIAVATAIGESGLINLGHGDTAGPDSRGLFQQRDSWGPVEVRMDPAGASRLFYEHLLAIPGWEELPLTVAAHKVQVNAVPGFYAKYETPAAGLVDRLAGGTPHPAGPCPVEVQATVGGMALPLPSEWVHPPMAEHHDYPAVDIGVPVGTPVFAVVGGTTRVVDELGGCGTGVALLDGAGNEWMYCHGSSRVVSGGTVAAGDQIMWSGSSGASTGPHLHIQIRVGGPGGRLACPQPLLDALATGRPVPAPAALPMVWPCVR